MREKIKYLLASANKGVTYFMDAVRAGSVKKYSKYGTFDVTFSPVEQEVVTSINGEVETKNTAKVGDAIVTGPQGEKYVLSVDKLKSRYTFVSRSKNGVEKWKANGTCYATPYHGKTFTFKAPWGEDMLCKSGDFICSTSTDGSDVYRIEKTVFLSTYREV